MIVKNEAHIIKDTLQNLVDKIQFSYYVISDTGSTDGTPKIIKSFFDSNRIPGEIYFNDWKDFGTNRTIALEQAYKKGDYLLIFDADDYIMGDINLSNLTADSYMLNVGNSSTKYSRMCLVSGNIKWKYLGVLHEYITTKEPIEIKTLPLLGEYYIVSGRTSSRNSDPEKYIKDAKILEEAYFLAVKNNDPLSHRYVYYTANSYKDAGLPDKAIEWYLLTLNANGWYDERYCSCLELFSLYTSKNMIQQGCYYLVKSWTFNPKRVEGIYLLIQHYTCEGHYALAWNYYSLIKNYFENEFKLHELSSFLFARITDYTFFLPYYMIIVCEKVREYSTGIKMYSIIFDNITESKPGEWWIKNLLYNFQFYEPYVLDDVFYSKFEKYIKYLEGNNIKY